MVDTECKQAEYNGIRARLYEEAMTKFPLARTQDIAVMHELLNPQNGEKIVGIGEGNGYFCNSILDHVRPAGQYLITDPSEDQLSNLLRHVKGHNLQMQVAGAESIELVEGYFDKSWSFGAFHHCPNQTEAIKRIYAGLRKDGMMVICDVFQGSKLAEHFDSQVASYCVTGHEVKFLSEAFARSLCYLAGFKRDRVEFIDLPIKWVFDKEKDIGQFIYKLHAMTNLPGDKKSQLEEVLRGCKEILGVNFNGSQYELNWPMKALVAYK
ncbi:class I SAM-dependent methyltransferase [Candidatus Pacearchaeota archaeon]|nr:class I SAM-dependent methyltransferase [Candidatus Pacearchaeota archaeon]